MNLTRSSSIRWSARSLIIKRSDRVPVFISKSIRIVFIGERLIKLKREKAGELCSMILVDFMKDIGRMITECLSWRVCLGKSHRKGNLYLEKWRKLLGTICQGFEGRSWNLERD